MKRKAGILADNDMDKSAQTTGKSFKNQHSDQKLKHQLPLSLIESETSR